jgi:LysM repeat protein
MTLYPTGYGTRRVTLDELFRIHHIGRMHPEYTRRLRAWLEAQNGRIGIGGSWRATGSQPDRPGFAPEGKSFHQTQRFVSGLEAFCAVDLVAVNPGGVHRSPRWDEVMRPDTAEARRWGLHCNVTSEPWHMQPIEIRGWQSWVNAGRREPVAGYPLPAPAPAPAPSPAPASSTYTVVRGDSWWTIAQRNPAPGRTIPQRIAELQRLNPQITTLRPGQTLRLGAAPAPTSAPAATYTIQRGDTWWGLASKLLGSGLKFRELQKANPGVSMHPGNKLRVP